MGEFIIVDDIGHWNAIDARKDNKITHEYSPHLGHFFLLRTSVGPLLWQRHQLVEFNLPYAGSLLPLYEYHTVVSSC